MDYGKSIYELRKSLNLTQKEFAQKTGISQASINHWENGKRTPKLEHLIQICGVFNIPLSRLIDIQQLKQEIRMYNSGVKKTQQELDSCCDPQKIFSLKIRLNSLSTAYAQRSRLLKHIEEYDGYNFEESANNHETDEDISNELSIRLYNSFKKLSVEDQERVIKIIDALSNNQ